ncbi:MAG: hypothetical protein PHX02_01630 [Oscillospiraceae bacterium]|nr:hypothetical protein [Oscillospiraceae bacterium]
MRLPFLQEIQTSRDMIQEFRGYNHNEVIKENEFYYMHNMSSSRYPVLSPRCKRGIGDAITKPNGIFYKECLYWVDGVSFYGNDGVNGETMLRGTVQDSPKTFVSMGALVLIWPDKKFYNTVTHLFGDLEKTWQAEQANISYTLVNWDPETKTVTEFADEYIVSDTAPAEPEDSDIWLDLSTVPNTFKKWSASSKMWIPIASSYVKIEANGIGVGFSRGDSVDISGSTNEYFNNTFVLVDVAENYIVVVGLIEKASSQNGGLIVRRSVPDMDFITECDNRLWGCSSANHEIYACKLGDPFNWNCFEGISTDSYSATIGSDGDFTGAATYMGYVFFFKEHCVHKIFGNKPSNFQITSSALRGVQKGSEKSLAIVNETLYYKSQNGIVAFDGSMPANVSDALGYEKYCDAVAAAFGDKYYVSMKDELGNWHMFVYDEMRRMWHREDNTHAMDFANTGDNLYFVNAADNKLYTVKGNNETVFEWFAETGDLAQSMPDNKYVSKIILRMELSSNSQVSIALRYDSDCEWQQVFMTCTPKKQSFTLPIIPHRCDRFNIRFAGKGDSKIFSISKVIEQGSEL